MTKKQELELSLKIGYIYIDRYLNRQDYKIGQLIERYKSDVTNRMRTDKTIIIVDKTNNIVATIKVHNKNRVGIYVNELVNTPTLMINIDK